MDVVEQNIFDVKSREVLPKMYLAYALSVIKDRSLPDIRDGLKPVARRILYSMGEMNLTSNKPTRKSARVVGEVMGKFHPHGDGSIYSAAARLIQDFTTRYPLLIGQGNFGSVEDKPAAMRYTEMKLAAISDEALADIDKETVDFMPNFDGTLKEPKVLPTKLPLFLLNGSVGIAVGMATSSPPHNLTEIVNSLLAYIENEDITVEEMMEHLKGPDFPSGAMMFDDENLQKIYKTGQGSVTLRANAVIDDNGKKKSIIITELPYQLDKSKLLTRISQLYQAKDKYEGIDGIADIRDESDKHGTRLVIDLRKGVQPKTVLNTLYRRTELQSKYSVFMRALINNEPKMVNLQLIYKQFVKHRKDVIIRRAEYDLKNAEAKMHILEGFLIVFSNLDAILEDIKTSTSSKITYKKLKKYKLSDKQIKAILELRVQRIAQFERDTIIADHQTLKEKIVDLKSLLASEELILNVMKEELIAIRDKYGDERRTIIVPKPDSNDETKLEEIQEEDVIITVTKNGLVKRTPISEYRVQNIRGKGLIGTNVKDDDYVTNIFQLSTHDYTLVFTNRGLCYKMGAHEIPSFGRTAVGQSILNILKLTEDERVVAVVPVSELGTKRFLLTSKLGQIKKLNGEKLRRPRSDGTKSMGLAENDQLIDVKLIDDDCNVLLVTKKGIAIRFSTDAIRETGRGASGIRAIRLSDNDYVVMSNIIANDEASLITVTKNGYAKRTKLAKFRAQRRGGRGIACMNINTLVGDIVSANIIYDNNEQIIAITSQGILIRIKVERIRELGRHTQGSRIQKLKTGDTIASVAYLGIIDDEEK